MTDTENVKSQQVKPTVTAASKRGRRGPREICPADGAASAGGAARGNSTLQEQLQEQRRQTTLMNAELYQLRQAREDLEFQLLRARSELLRARSELTASRNRRKEMARVITRRDSEIQLRYRELAALERHILRFSPSWVLKNVLNSIRRSLRPRS